MGSSNEQPKSDAIRVDEQDPQSDRYSIILKNRFYSALRTIQTYITKKALHDILQLPSNVNVRSLYYDFDMDCIRIRLDSATFPIVEYEEGATIKDPLVMPHVNPESGKIEWIFPVRED